MLRVSRSSTPPPRSVLPPWDTASAGLWDTAPAGRLKGREVQDKIAACGVDTLPSKVVRPPRLAGCVAWLECKLVRPDLAETEGIVILEAILAESPYLKADGSLDVVSRPTLHHLGGDCFVADGAVIDLTDDQG